MNASMIRNRYVGDSVATASPARLVTMLYDRLVRDLVTGEAAIVASDLAAANEALVHAQEIVWELADGLDTTKWSGGPALAALYQFILQELLAANCERIEEGMRLVRREFPTDIGPVDLLCKAADGTTIAVEIKRRGEIDGVEQLTRYLDFLNRDPMLRPVRGVFVAQQVKPQARVLAADRGITWVEVDYDELRGIESRELRLF